MVTSFRSYSDPLARRRIISLIERDGLHFEPVGRRGVPGAFYQDHTCRGVLPVHADGGASIAKTG
jgi:hypothetical protein